jgi:bifunctional pyridoxal-dependent enzyme with beta-cystathionase and maltose regulon repressor activities
MKTKKATKRLDRGAVEVAQVPDMTRMQIAFMTYQSGRRGLKKMRILVRCNVMILERKFGEGHPMVTIEVVEPQGSPDIVAVVSQAEHVRGGKVV